MLHERTIAELELRRAQLVEQATRARDEQQTGTSTGPNATVRARKVKSLQQRANDYAWILATVAEQN